MMAIRCAPRSTRASSMAAAAVMIGYPSGIFESGDVPSLRFVTQKVGRAGAGKPKDVQPEFVELPQRVAELPQVLIEATAGVGRLAAQADCHQADAIGPERPHLLFDSRVCLGYANAHHASSTVFGRSHGHAPDQLPTFRSDGPAFDGRPFGKVYGRRAGHRRCRGTRPRARSGNCGCGPRRRRRRRSSRIACAGCQTRSRTSPRRACRASRVPRRIRCPSASTPGTGPGSRGCSSRRCPPASGTRCRR